MIHYYAFCSAEGRRVGDKTTDINKARTDVETHQLSYPSHDNVYVKESNITTVNGVRKYSYRKITFPVK